jgi:O-antigen/teichoic acid export membrane protein
MLRDVFVRNVGLSTVLKLSTFVLQFAMLPLLMKALGKGEYGVWVVLQSLVIWIAVLELGIGKGLRNKLIESLGVGDHRLARRYLSSTLFGQVVLWGLVAFVLVVLLFLMDFPLASWLRSSSSDRTIAWSLLFCFLTFALTQLSGVMNAILYAKHWNSATALVSFLASIGLFLYLLIAQWNAHAVSLPRLASTNFLLFALGYTVQASYLIRCFPDLVPRWSEATWGIFLDVARIGLSFLFIEITYMVIFMTDRLIVLRILGPAMVAEYDVVLRLSALATTGFALCIGPIWALSGAAWANQDRPLMLRLWRIVTGLMIPFGMVSIAIGFAMNPLIHFWIDRSITLSPMVRWSMVGYTWVVIWGAAYASLLNGIGRTREQVVCSIFASLMNVPLAIWLCGIEGIGISGVLISSALSLSLFGFIAPFVWMSCMKQCVARA